MTENYYRCWTVIGLLATFSLCGQCSAVAAESLEPMAELLWPNGAPGGGEPKITAFLAAPDKSNGTAVVVCPGGSYRTLAEYEGVPVAQWLNTFGVAGFVLEYRHSGTGFHHPAPIQDLQRAIRTVRARSAKWKIKPDRIGVLGFSAGGHLCSTAATHFDNGDSSSHDPVERAGCRPDFAILIYATTNLTDQYTHKDTRRGLLGDNPKQKLIELLSNDARVTAETPPTFLVHSWDDEVVPVENSVLFYMALRNAKVPAEMHLFRKGGHGGSLKHNDWPPLAQRWMRIQGLIPSSMAAP
jgi:acetyl esterase/lipase